MFDKRVARFGTKCHASGAIMLKSEKGMIFMENEEVKDETKEEKKLTIKSIFSGNNLKNLIIFAGIIGIALIFLSSFMGRKNDETEAPVSETKTTAESYAQKLEDDLGKIISNIDGAGKTNILITIDREIENVYQTDTDATAKSDSEGSQQNNKSSTVVIRSKNSTEEPIKVTEIMPKIKGVLVVCEGADSSVVKQNIIDSVRTVLGVASSRVSVQKYSKS